MSLSEYARIKKQIEEEYAAAKLALEGIAMTAQHAFISARMENIAACHQELTNLVGKEEATKIIAETLWRPLDGKGTENKES